MTHDPISDLFIRIKNAQARRHPSVIMPASKTKEAIAQVLTREGYVGSVKRTAGTPSDLLEIDLLYPDNQPRITTMTRVSKPGNRVYRSTNRFPRPMSGHGLVIVSTPQGIMSNRAARKANLGGEIIATVW